MKSLRNKILTASFILVLGFVGAVFAQTDKAGALSGSQWQPGYIIDDSLFFSPNLMGAGDIQTFLSAKVPVCDTNGSQPSGHGSYSRAEWGTINGAPPPYICLKDYVQNVPGTTADAYCAYGVSAGTKSAAMIIAEVGWACQVNPQVLIVLLQKEQGLVTDDWPWPNQYRSATGYGCPDTAACDSQYYGFFNQVYNAARQFQKYVKQPQSFNYRAGQTSNILWKPAGSGCGGANVYIQNGATAALYNYTPYQPNQAALDNLYGTGDGCSSYGNRNFWRMFNDWFGPAMGSLVKTPYDNTVYLLNGNTAHAIYDLNILNDYAALGPVRITSASEINTHAAGPVLGRMVGGSDGTLYLVNSSIKLPFTSCDSVADYAYTCANVMYLSDLLLNKLHNGPQVTPLLKSNADGTVYYVTGGSKRPILSWGDLLSFHVPLINSLSDSFVNGQISTNPIPAYGSGTMVKTANSDTVYLVKDINQIMPVSNFIYPHEMGLSSSIRTIASTYTVINPIENKIKCGGSTYLATNGYRYLVSGSMMTHYGFNAGHFIEVGLLCQNITEGPVLNRYIRTNDGSIYYINAGQKQPFAGYDAYVAHGGNASNTVSVSSFFASTIPTGAVLY